MFGDFYTVVSSEDKELCHLTAWPRVPRHRRGVGAHLRLARHLRGRASAFQSRMMVAESLVDFSFFNHVGEVPVRSWTAEIVYCEWRRRVCRCHRELFLPWAAAVTGHAD